MEISIAGLSDALRGVPHNLIRIRAILFPYGHGRSSGILTTWTRMGKTVHTCLNMLQTCMYMFRLLHTNLNMYERVINMYIFIYRLYVHGTYIFMNVYMCMYMVHTHAYKLIYVWKLYRHVCAASQPHFIFHQALSALRRRRVSAPRMSRSF